MTMAVRQYNKEVRQTCKSFQGMHERCTSMNRTVGALLQSKLSCEQTEISAREALQTIASEQMVVAPMHLLTAQRNLMVVLAGRDQPSEAIAVGEAAYAGFLRCLGAVHPITVSAVRELSMIVLDAGRYREAEPLLRSAASGCVALFGTVHPDSLNAMLLLGQALTLGGKKLDEAKELFREHNAPCNALVAS